MLIETAGGQPLDGLPSGWNHVTGSPQATGTTTNGTQLTVLWKRATSSSETNPTIPHITGGDHVFAQIVTFRGCIATGDPWDVTAGGVKAVASSTLSIPGLTTNVSDCLVAVMATRDTDASTAWASNWANASLANVTERYDANSGIGTGGGLALATGDKSAAGTVDATTLDLAASCVNAYLVVALRP